MAGLSTEDITIYRFPKTKDKPSFRLYYYQGNFFFPIFQSREIEKRIGFLIKKFIKENQALVSADRAHPDYKSWKELVDEAFAD